MKRYVVRIAAAAIAAGALTITACGGGGGGTSPSPAPAPSPTPSPTPTPGGGTTFTITSAGVSPKSLTVPVGTRVTFINNDNRTHDMESDPHPEHTDCPPINQVGFMTPGQTKLTGNLNTARTCGFHDHDQSDNRNLQGTIIIQ